MSNSSPNSSGPLLGLSSAVTKGESFDMQPPSEPNRRNWMIACGAVGAGAAAAVAVPFLGSMAPSEKARSAGAPVEVDISDIPVGGVKIVEWRGKPVWVVRRTPEMVKGLEALNSQLADPTSDRTDYPVPAYAKNIHRSISPRCS